MSTYEDLEGGQEYKQFVLVSENEILLPVTQQDRIPDQRSRYSFTWSCSASNSPSPWKLALAFFGGVFSCVLLQLLVGSRHSFIPNNEVISSDGAYALAPPYVGSTEVHPFPPASPTNIFPTLFPTNVGHAGPTPTGAEPALIATAPAYPIHSGAAHLVSPTFAKPKASKDFDLFKQWGNLSPWFSVDKHAFGVDSGPEAPETCRVTGLHLLHRHGARYPTGWASFGGPASFATKLHESADKWNASDSLSFLNDWTYKLGEEILTPFGRQQLFDLGVSMRMKYGFLLKNFTESNTVPVFRTESQDRMLASALNFAIGFFGYPFEEQYQQSVTIEDPGYNNTLAPYKTCPNAGIPSKADRGLYYVQQWTSVYLQDALARLSPQLTGFNLTIEDVYTFQQLCAYETVAIGYSKFCELFTEEEWEGFDYAMDLYFWYDSAFGAPLAKVLGIGYVQELVARLTHMPIEMHNTSTNSTLDDSPVTFPLGQSLYVDATHEVVVLHVITALNLTTLASSGPLPADHIPSHRSFKASYLAPFATNIQFQLLSCSSVPDPQIRIIINDGVAPLTGIKGCPDQKDGMCPLATFVEAQNEIIQDADWEYGCHGDWEVPAGPAWNTTTGLPPPRR
ncbi:phosphoglycerate mutase-like protein [Laetiporus sulphureus 93-53]|uniref:Phosphoglycerate mutase-like protein n=1 Tax=Laetiporus sulphureus 93-53 TaxID=1314785 RepID=A0A165HA92_9APHY|nr:phosphoglycerate mutase-like protein [Laetiporus sulphureus 93-53]KZT11458.1 phosphoglycerate mutase-like protein [Laetiporus sulphureus 93-53]